MSKWQKCFALAGLVAPVLGLTGCGGINASGSVSPAMFLLQVQPDRPAPVNTPVPDLAMVDVAHE